MIPPANPPDEEKRVAALHELELLDTPAEDRFDRVTRLARKLFRTPYALVSLVDHDRQWFKSCQGIDVCELPRAISFCGHAILTDSPLIVPDAIDDLRFCDNPAVIGPPHVRFYAGQSVRSMDGSRVGVLCVLDDAPRSEFGPEEVEALRDLAGLVEDELRVKRLSQVQNRLISEHGEQRRKELTDPLTRLWSREGIVRVLEAELESAKATGRDVGVLLLELDGLSQMTDSYGRDAGDRVLQECACRIRATVRSFDAVGRHRGEKLLCVLHGVDGPECLRAAERIRERITGAPFGCGAGAGKTRMDVTASFGVACSSEFGPYAQTLVAAADQALHRARVRGNRVEYAEDLAAAA